jgi:hypothetical protein
MAGRDLADRALQQSHDGRQLDIASRMTADNPGTRPEPFEYRFSSFFPVAFLFFASPCLILSSPAQATRMSSARPVQPLTAIGLFYTFFCLPGSGSGADEICLTSTFVFRCPAGGGDCPEVSRSAGLSRKHTSNAKLGWRLCRVFRATTGAIQSACSGKFEKEDRSAPVRMSR